MAVQKDLFLIAFVPSLTASIISTSAVFELFDSFSICSSLAIFSLQEIPIGLFSELISGTVSGVFVPLLPKSSFFF